MTIGFVLPYVYLTTITPISGQGYGFSSLNFDVSYNGIIYTGAVGSTPTTTQSATGLNVDNLEFTIIKSGLPFTELQVSRGLLQDARVSIQIEDLALLPTPGNANFIFNGFVARVESLPTCYKLELRSISSKLNNPLTYKTSPYCSFAFGGTQCGINLSSLSLIHSTTVASTTLNGDGTVNVTLSAAIPSLNRPRYELGSMLVTSGSDINRKLRLTSIDQSTGLVVRIRDYPPFGLANGSAVTLTAHCDKTQSRCQAYNNYTNFGGFPQGTNFMRGMDVILSSGIRAGEKA